MISAVCVQAQTLSPREIFYGQGRAPVAPKTTTAARPKANVAKAKPEAEPASPTAGEVASSAPSPSPDTAELSLGNPQEHLATLAASKTGPLGLKYSVLKRDADGQYHEVDADSSFVAHDHIKVSVEVNDTGYLYVVAQGTSGIWKIMYPSREINGGDNRVREGKVYSVPSEGVFTFDSHAGTEKLFVVLSRQPEQDLESLIYSLRDKAPTNDAAPQKGEVSRALMASNASVHDDVVQRLRQTYSRDLVIEKVDDAKTPPPDDIKKIEVKHGGMIPPGEKAVYVVNRNAGDNARVVADVELHHQ